MNAITTHSARPADSTGSPAAGPTRTRPSRLSGQAGKTSDRPSRLSGRLGAAAAVAGIAYTLSWAAGLALPVPNLAVTASGADVIARYGSHLAAVQAQFALIEGLPAIGLAVVAALLALAARRAGARRLSVAAAASGGIAAVISLTQYALGLALTGWALPGRAPGPVSGLFEAVNRLDGAKMLALTVLGITAAAVAGPGGLLPRWLRFAGLALAAAITVSGMGYLLLFQALAPMAYPAGMLLLIFVTGTGVALGRRARASADGAGSRTGQAREDGGCPGLA